MVVSFAVNAVSSFCFMIILLFFMGDPEKALETPTYWPIIEICRQAARNLDGTNALMSMIIIPGIVSYFNSMASVSRLAWAFGECIQA
jgi:choline transport protein